jgi:hypothetical protein
VGKGYNVRKNDKILYVKGYTIFHQNSSRNVGNFVLDTLEIQNF